MTFGERLVKSREAAHLSQRGLADILGITPTRLNYWEKDKRQPDVQMIKALAVALNVSADYLISSNYETKNAPSISDEAQEIAKRYDSLDTHGKEVVDTVIIAEEKRIKSASESNIIKSPETKIIPLFGTSFAAGPGEPDTGNLFEDYEVPYDSTAEFAIHINGDSMEPYLHDSSVALGRKKTPKDGDVAAVLLDGTFLCKQVCEDSFGNVYLFSLNRERADADVVVHPDSDHTLLCFGTIIMPKRIPLPKF